MGNKKYLITKEKLHELKEEYARLSTKKMAELDENYEKEQSEKQDEFDTPFYFLSQEKYYLQSRLSELKDIIENADIIKEGNSNGFVDIGSKVTVGFEHFTDDLTMVSSLEADPLKKKISDKSPVGSALMGKKVGDKVVAKVGSIRKIFRILEIK